MLSLARKCQAGARSHTALNTGLRVSARQHWPLSLLDQVMRNAARRFLADPRFQKALEVGLGISMTSGDAFARGNGAGAAAPPPGAEASAAAPMEEEEEEYDDDDDGPPPLEVRGTDAGNARLLKAWCRTRCWGTHERWAAACERE